MRARCPERVEDVAGEFATHPFVHEILDFIREGKDRAICTPRDPVASSRCSLMRRDRTARSRSSPGPGSCPSSSSSISSGPGRITVSWRSAASPRRSCAGAPTPTSICSTSRPSCSTLDGWQPAGRHPRRRGAPSGLLRACSAPIRCCATGRRCKEVIARGDDQVLRGAVMLLEERGHRVVGAHELAPDLVASAALTRHAAAGRRGRPAGHRGRPRSSRARSRPSTSARRAVVAARACARHRRPEGTDRMLRRVAAHAPILVRPAPARGGRRPDQGGQARAGSARRHAGHRAAHRRRGGARGPVRHRRRRRLDPRRSTRTETLAHRPIASACFSSAVDLPWMERPMI